MLVSAEVLTRACVCCCASSPLLALASAQSLCCPLLKDQATSIAHTNLANFSCSAFGSFKSSSFGGMRSMGLSHHACAFSLSLCCLRACLCTDCARVLLAGLFVDLAPRGVRCTSPFACGIACFNTPPSLLAFPSGVAVSVWMPSFVGFLVNAGVFPPFPCNCVLLLLLLLLLLTSPSARLGVAAIV